jgi:hypothetical protein
MSVFFRCDQCGEVTEGKDLRRIVAIYPMGSSLKNALMVVDLHAGDLCITCVEAIKAVLPQEHPPTIEGSHDAP